MSEINDIISEGVLIKCAEYGVSNEIAAHIYKAASKKIHGQLQTIAVREKQAMQKRAKKSDPLADRWADRRILQPEKYDEQSDPLADRWADRRILQPEKYDEQSPEFDLTNDPSNKPAYSDPRTYEESLAIARQANPGLALGGTMAGGASVPQQNAILQAILANKGAIGGAAGGAAGGAGIAQLLGAGGLGTLGGALAGGVGGGIGGHYLEPYLR